MDITERKRQEEALDRATRLQRRSGEIAKIGGWTMEVESGQSQWTEEVYRIHDLEPGEPIDAARALEFYTDESRPLITDAVARSVRYGEPYDLELEIVTRKQRHVWVRVQGEPVYENAVVASLSGAFQDITERKQAQLELQRLNATLLKLSYKDPLTGLGNRRLFDERLRSEWSLTSRRGGNLAVIMIDVDYFKKYNDFHGHQQGDECLQQVASALTAALLRGHEDAYRYGGEEFVVLLPETDLAGARVVGQRILEQIERLKLPHGASPIGMHVTASLGAATATAEQFVAGLTANELVKMADEALYRAKGEGRARMVS